MHVALGSTNPVKIAATHQVLEKALPRYELTPVAVTSGVSAMPMSDQECIRGARNRAQAARQQTGAPWGVGIEGGVHLTSHGMMLTGWAVIIDERNREGIGSGGRLPLPQQVALRLQRGEELGPVMDDLLQIENVKQKEGAVGAFTAGIVNRRDALAMAFAFALAPFLTPALYHDG